MSERKDNETKPDEQKSRLAYCSKMILETSIDGFCVIDIDGRILEVNSAYCDIIGYPKEELIGKQVGDIEANETPEQISEHKREVMKKGYCRFETRHRRKNGRIIDIEVSSQFCNIELDKFFFSFFRDITKRKKAEEALRNSEEKYKKLFEETTDAIFVADAETGVLVDCNTAAVKLVDKEKSELVGKHQRILHPPEEIEGEFSRTFKQHLREKEGQILESQIITKKGEIRDVAIRANRFELGGRKWIQAMFRDITERKKTEEALRESEERYKTLFQRAAEGIVVADTETKEFKYVNPAICKMLGYTEEELGQFGVRDIHPKEDLQRVISEFEAQARGEKTLSSNIPCLRKDGTIIYADISATTVLIDGRQCNVGFFTDITETKRIKAELENYKEKILQAQKHAYIASMGAIVAHQLNQPLTMINMLLARTLEQIEDESCCPSVLENVRESLDEVKNAASIVRKFRQYSKYRTLEAVGKVNLSNVANRIISTLSERVKQAKMNISLRNMDELPEVETNEAALEQVFLIIIQNAIEASDGRKWHKLDIVGKSTDDDVELRFSDDCCGIAPENLDKIFEPFFSTKSDGKGIGLGLDIIQQILISFGGEIRVKSQLGKGATFYLTLPVSDTMKS